MQMFTYILGVESNSYNLRITLIEQFNNSEILEMNINLKRNDSTLPISNLLKVDVRSALILSTLRYERFKHLFLIRLAKSLNEINIDEPQFSNNWTH